MLAWVEGVGPDPGMHPQLLLLASNVDAHCGMRSTGLRVGQPDWLLWKLPSLTDVPPWA